MDNPLSDARISRLCGILLEWAEGYARKQIGPEAEEYAGIGLFKALGRYDRSRSKLRSFLPYALRQEIRQEMRDLGEWYTCKKYQQQKQFLAVEDFDQATFAGPGSGAMKDRDAESATGKRLIQDEEMYAVVIAIESLPDPQRMVAMCRLIGGFSAQATGRMLALTPRTINGHLKEAKQHLQSQPMANG